MLLQCWKNFTFIGWWWRETLVWIVHAAVIFLVLFAAFTVKDLVYFLICHEFLIFVFFLSANKSHQWELTHNIFFSCTRVERIFLLINTSISDGSLFTTLSLKKIPLVLSRFSALFGLLVYVFRKFSCHLFYWKYKVEINSV